MAHRLVVGVMALLGAVSIAGLSMPDASASPAGGASAFTAPVSPGDFPDPYVMLSGGRYWAYATGSAGRNLQVISSADLAAWSAPSDPLPRLPRWASAGHTWAPGVVERNGIFIMYYTVRDSRLGHQCISVATSRTPAGPFVDTSSRPLICQSSLGGSIDPNPYLDPISGHWYLLWKSDDNSLGLRTHIWGQQLASNGLSLQPRTSPSLILTQSAAWQSPAIEGPSVVRNGALYYLFYGANNYDTASSGIGYATSRSLLGPYTNQSTTGPWLGTTGNAQGPQGPSIFSDSAGTLRMAFAAWYGKVGYENGGVRSMWIGSLGFSGEGTPALQ